MTLQPALLVLVGLAAGLTVLVGRPNPYRVKRTTYFLLHSAVILVLTAALAGAALVFSRESIALLVLIFVAGLAIGWLAIGRARDAFGLPWLALLAFVPVLGLMLLLVPPRPGVSQPYAFTRSWQSGWPAILGGLALAAASLLVAWWSGG